MSDSTIDANIGDSPERPLWRRWFLRPWLILLTATLLMTGPFAYRCAMKARAAEVLESLPYCWLQFETPDWLEPLEEYLPSLPRACYASLEAAHIEFPPDEPLSQRLMTELYWFPELTELDLSFDSSQKSDLDQNTYDGRISADMRRFSSLEILRRGISLGEFDPSRFSNLQYVHLSCVRVDKRFFEQLKACRRCEQISLFESPLVDDDVQQIGQLQQLRELTTINCGLTDEMVRPLGRLNQLDILWLDEKQLTDDGLEILDHLPKLRILTIGSAKMTTKTLDRINRLPLDVLSLERVPIFDQDLRHLSSSALDLRRLYLNELPLTEESLNLIVRHSNLRLIELKCAGIRIEAARRLRAHKKLETLSINGCDLNMPISDPPTCQKKTAFPFCCGT